jgi:alkanesulfonate monooxygenase SsuD/methylene tetrahydromethanopterin reductase-like flavin-dependent oxidoreductase (luciferase family)
MRWLQPPASCWPMDPEEGKRKAWDLTACPMVMDELRRVAGKNEFTRADLPASGPLIICEGGRRPWTSKFFTRAWRKIATAAGIPASVQNRDSRSGAATEAKLAGAVREDIQRGLGHPVQEPHPPVFLAGATERSIGVAGRMGFGLMLSSWTPFAELARQTALYRAHLEETPTALRANPARGHVDINRLVYVAETDAIARRDSEAGILRHLSHFSSGHTSGYLGTVQEKTIGNRSGYDALAHDIILHGSPQTVAEKIAHLRDTAGATSIMVHYPPWYGAEKALASLELFATEVAPKLRGPAERVSAA